MSFLITSDKNKCAITSYFVIFYILLHEFIEMSTCKLFNLDFFLNVFYQEKFFNTMHNLTKQIFLGLCFLRKIIKDVSLMVFLV